MADSLNYFLKFLLTRRWDNMQQITIIDQKSKVEVIKNTK
jgi:hypothetical protein